MFVTHVTNKTNYKDSVTKRTTLLRLMAKTDQKPHNTASRVGFMLYLTADDYAKEALKQEEAEGKLLLEGAEGDENRTELVSAIMPIIATESPT